ncbi:hypothetical protein Golomagni_05307, partial [Golovinomyces magnicellulatus]
TPIQLDRQAQSVLRNLTQTQGTEEYYHSSNYPNDQQTNQFHYPKIPIPQSNFQPTVDSQRLNPKSNKQHDYLQENERVENDREIFQNNPFQNVTNHVSTKIYESSIGFRSIGDLMKVYSMKIVDC